MTKDSEEQAQLRRIEEIEADISESDDPVGELLLWARSPSPKVRGESYRALADYWEDPRTLPFLLARLDDEPDLTARGLACVGFGRFLDTVADEGATESDFVPDPYTAPVLRQLSFVRAIFQRILGLAADSTGPLELRRRAVEALGSFAYRPEVSALLETLYACPEESAQVSALFAMGRSGLKRYRKRLLKHLEDPRPAIQFEAIQAVEWWELRAALPLLRRIILSEKNPNRGDALVAYARYAPTQKLRSLLRHLRQGPRDPVVDQVLPDIEEQLLDDMELGTRDDEDFADIFTED